MLIAKLNEGTNIMEALKAVKIKDLVYWTALAWDNVKHSTLQNL